MGDENKNDRVVSPESEPIHLNFSLHPLFMLIYSAHLNKDAFDVVCIILGKKIDIQCLI